MERSCDILPTSSSKKLTKLKKYWVLTKVDSFREKKNIQFSQISIGTIKSGLSKFFKDCLPQNLLIPLLNTLSQIKLKFDVAFSESSGTTYFYQSKESSANFVSNTNADLKIFLYVCVQIKTNLSKFCILNPKNSQVICLRSLKNS